MDQQRVDMFMMTNGKFFESSHLYNIRERLIKMEDDRWAMLQTMQFKDPTISLIISLLVGYLGIDRMYIGHIGLGILKLLTCGGLGIWTIVDWFLIMTATREENMKKFNEMVG
jgi:TM2 domain-containing membrane protein YozV